MKTMVVKVPDSVAADIETESHERRISKSDVMRERLAKSTRPKKPPEHLKSIAHLIGSVVDDLPEDLSARTEEYLRATGYGRDRGR